MVAAIDIKTDHVDRASLPQAGELDAAYELEWQILGQIVIAGYGVMVRYRQGFDTVCRSETDKFRRRERAV